jgi:hypothetical protein
MGSRSSGSSGGNARKGRKKPEGGGGGGAADAPTAPAPLPALEGTSRQVDWANNIRDKMMNDLDNAIKLKEQDAARTSGEISEGHKEIGKTFQDLKNLLSKEKDATSFIGIRSQDPWKLNRELAGLKEENPGRSKDVESAFRSAFKQEGFSQTPFGDRLSDAVQAAGLNEW